MSAPIKSSLIRIALIAGLALFSLSCSSQPNANTDPEPYVAKLARAKEAGPAGIAQLAPLLVSPDGRVRRGAMRTLREIALHATRPGADAERRAATQALVKLAREHPDLGERMQMQLRQILSVVAPDPARVADLLPTVGGVRFVPPRQGPAAATTQAVAMRDVPASVRKGQGTSAELDAWLSRLQGMRKNNASTGLFQEYDALLASDRPQIRAAALHALSEMGGTGLIHDYLDCLDSDNLSLRQIGMAALVALQAEGTTKKLLASWERATPRTRGGILRVLIRRGDSEGLTLLQRAAREGTVTQRVVALELMGGLKPTEVQDLLLETLGQSDPKLQGAAAAALTQMAARQLDQAEKQVRALPAAARKTAGAKMEMTAAAEARALLHPVLENCKGTTELRLAMRVLARCADADSLALVQPLLADKVTREAAARVSVAAAETLTDKELAKRILNEVYDASPSRSTRRAAIDGLEALGVSTTSYARRKGFINEWFLMGGLPKTSKETLGQHPFGSEGPDPSRSLILNGKRLAWHKKKTKDPDGIYDLSFLKPKIDTAAYAFTILDWPRAESLLIKAGSDDSIAIWVNGKLVHNHYIPRGIAVDSDEVPVHFREGPNRILVKIGQGSGGWGFCIRLATKDGKPIDLTKMASTD